MLPLLSLVELFDTREIESDIQQTQQQQKRKPYVRICNTETKLTYTCFFKIKIRTGSILVLRDQLLEQIYTATVCACMYVLYIYNC